MVATAVISTINWSSARGIMTYRRHARGPTTSTIFFFRYQLCGPFSRFMKEQHRKSTELFCIIQKLGDCIDGAFGVVDIHLICSHGGIFLNRNSSFERHYSTRWLMTTQTGDDRWIGSRKASAGFMVSQHPNTNQSPHVVFHLSSFDSTLPSLFFHAVSLERRHLCTA